MKRLGEKFFNRKAEIVAKELLGKIFVRNINNLELKSRIVETEAYYGAKDPASRAFKKSKMSMPMFAKPGTLFIYNVHKYWMFNIVTEREGKAGAVLIRALEPLNFKANLSGPGKLTTELKICKEKYNNKHLTEIEDIKILDLNSSINQKSIKIARSHRIGVSKDLKKKLRFFIKNNPYVSK
ncbi:MAG: DNA-3-methyladenine glycosylase [Candidatus Pacearchaeota archaeon]|nr:DNA-3-methyladenine glycosylase [Candidatus Pacearchaeota archaeon]